MEENKPLYKFNLITPSLVEFNGSNGKLSLNGSNLFLNIAPKSTLKDLYDKASEIINSDENKFLLWIIENENFIRKKIECTEKFEVETLLENGYENIFVQYLNHETNGDLIFLVFTYFPNLVPAIHLIFTTAISEESTLNDLIEKYCNIMHYELSTHFTLSYRLNDHEINKIDSDQYDIKIKDIPEISSILVIQPNDNQNNNVLLNQNSSQQYNENKYSNTINYFDRVNADTPNNIEEFLIMTSNMKTIKIIKPPSTSKISTSSEISFLFRFPLMISFDNFKFFIISYFSPKGINPSQCFLFYPELSTKPLLFDNLPNTISMEEVFHTINFEKLYVYSFPYIHFSSMINVSRILLIRPNNQDIITHFFRDDMPFYKVIEYAYQKRWINNNEKYTLVYRKNNDGLIESQVNPNSLVESAENPIYFYSFQTNNNEYSCKDILIPVEYIKTNESPEKYSVQHFMFKIIPEESFAKSMIRFQEINGIVFHNCQFKIYNKEFGETELDQDSVLSYEENITLRIYQFENL